MAREAQDGIKTVECLRGRLLAERIASRTAKAEATHMAKRLKELEKQLEEEMKNRERAEKRLLHAMKKLQSLKLMNFPFQMDLLDNTESSTFPNRVFLNQERFEKWKFLKKCSASSRDLIRDDGSLNSFSDLASHGDGGSSSSSSSSSTSQECADGTVREPSKNIEKLNCNENPTQHHNGEALALVPVSISQEPETYNPEVKNNVYDVLFSLRHVREQLQNSIGRTVAFNSLKELSSQHRTSTISMEASPSK